MVHMDVLYPRSLNQKGEVDSEPGMEERAQPPSNRLVSLEQCATKEIPQRPEFSHAQERGIDQQPDFQRLQAQSFIGQRFQLGNQRRSDVASAAWDYRYPAFAEFLNLPCDIRFNRGRKLVSEVSDDRH